LGERVKKRIALAACLALILLTVAALALLRPAAGASLRFYVVEGPVWTRCYALAPGWSAYRSWYVLSPYGDVRIRDSAGCLDERSNVVLVSAFEGSVIYFNALSCNALPDQTRRTLTEVVADNESLEPQDRSALLESLSHQPSRCDRDLNGFSCFCELS
jgi:hypothetical protein